VKRERLDFLADNARYTKRFAYYVGRRCRSATIKDIAKELHLSWDAVKELEKQYMRAQLARAGTPGPKRIGIDEISIRKRHVYRIVVSDLDRARPIWFGGEDRSEASMAQFYAWLGEQKSRRIKLALMDMWKPFRNATEIHAPQAAILFDKFHVMRHLGKALDQGFEDDERDFRIGANMLRRMGFREVRLMTNNPAKVAMMEGCGLAVVERVPLKVGGTRFNEGYLRTKAAKSGHLL
jgi:transposase